MIAKALVETNVPDRQPSEPHIVAYRSIPSFHLSVRPYRLYSLLFPYSYVCLFTHLKQSPSNRLPTVALVVLRSVVISVRDHLSYLSRLLIVGKSSSINGCLQHCLSAFGSIPHLLIMWMSLPSGFWLLMSCQSAERRAADAL